MQDQETIALDSIYKGRVSLQDRFSDEWQTCVHQVSRIEQDRMKERVDIFQEFMSHIEQRERVHCPLFATRSCFPRHFLHL